MSRNSGFISDRPGIFAGRMAFITLCIIIVILAATGSASAFDSYYLVRDGNIALNEGRYRDAEFLFEKYLDSHPASRGENSTRYRKRRQYYIKNLLSVYNDLFTIYRETGNEAKLVKRLALLKSTFDNGDFSDKNAYNLAEIYLSLNLQAEARPLLENIVANNVISHYPYNIKVMLRACSKLTKIYGSTGESLVVEKLISTLEENYPDPGFDINDKYNLAQLYLQNGRSEKGVALLNEIAAEEPFDSRSPFAYTLTKAYVKLLNISHENQTPAVRQKLMAQLSAGKVDQMSPGNSYKFAIAMLNSGEKEAGRKLLDTLSTQYPETVWARKSLFLRARDAMNAKDWDTAIDRYSTYIDRYPGYTFFALKAYSSLLDAHWARDGNLEEQKIRVEFFADILNEVADYETKLNLARDLKNKGFEQLAESTFNLGMAEVKSRLEGALEDEERLRIHWIIQKYAYPLERYSVVENSSLEVLSLVNNSRDELFKSSEKSRFIKSQAYIWLGQTYQQTGRSAEAIKTYTDFLGEFRTSSDANFVRYSLAEVYEDTGEMLRAMKLYKKIDAGVWKTRASQKLDKQGLLP
jgi:outer membrane protein assembly factor BamD (BamD/ComL family)